MLEDKPERARKTGRRESSCIWGDIFKLWETQRSAWPILGLPVCIFLTALFFCSHSLTMFPRSSAKQYFAVVYTLLLKASNKCSCLWQQDLNPHDWLSGAGMVTIWYICEGFQRHETWSMQKGTFSSFIESNLLPGKQSSGSSQDDLAISPTLVLVLGPVCSGHWISGRVVSHAAFSNHSTFAGSIWNWPSHHLLFRFWCPQFREISWKQSQPFQ